ncbi:MAG: winged helix-turn-helix transcriptional regulator [Myxococcales bacterium]|nr:winged helix-turn-helix transcriptional regulator [Myxococcales bacterium]
MTARDERRAALASRLDALEQVTAALAHATRRQILMTVHFWGGQMTAGEIAARFDHAWPTITRHLGVLVRAGLLGCEKVGRTRVYAVRKERLEVLRDWLDWFEPKKG